ncbi:hypothetical protein PYCCODRAFT_1431301 [Trametes coccinea BRFM310]|uniref:F-box domain-containing protein n=1 Tax=Trametes coccinea (strain BRFM310) TaxID=1353009 RepID=A0A1Y2J145_TRAC3|nr:hypothetical protein PYCCODRAFT_1431301 [Trametes coccinea BRFM310]
MQRKRSKRRDHTAHTVVASTGMSGPSIALAGLPSSTVRKPGQATRGLRRLDEDVLLQIFEELRPEHGLRPLSLTCKWVRESVKPVLFRSCRQDALCLDWELFVPRQLWPYIQNLLFHGIWADIDPPHDNRRYDPFPLRQNLFEMSQLTTVRIVKTMEAGVPWTALVAILSLPQLRAFDIAGALYRERPERPHVPTFTAAPLRNYKQVLTDYRLSRYSLPDSLVLCVVLNQSQIQESLESLEVPSEFAPLLLIAECRWSRLKRVVLRGENWEDDRPVVDLFIQMPALQELVLTLSHPQRSDLHRLCSPDWAGPLPWPELKTLSLTYPDPSDPVYSWLPTTLRHLTLCCWPRHYNSEDPAIRSAVETLGWDSPIQDSSAMLNILRRCQCRQLESLEIEFVGSESDMELFQLISHVFPDLSSLTLFRYRPRPAVKVPVREIGESLRPLQRLRYLFLYLDFVEAPRLVYSGFRLGPFSTRHPEVERARIMRIFERSADSIARSLGPSLSIISFLLRGASANDWIAFRVRHASDGCHVHLAPQALEEHGLKSRDHPTPPVPLY